MPQNKAAAQTTAAGKVVRSVSGAELSGQDGKDKIPGSMRPINNEKAEAGDQSSKIWSRPGSERQGQHDEVVPEAERQDKRQS
ncbi:hypothetical protein [uncultured Alistipes sp.]|uniref:hypothetical protein n=1 Tax=uncultured Alistipes sp. TaxID=538949 RepID=UPI002602D59C|nr:hypothetical protein [uncultured Alistipes sp.]